MNNTQQKGFTLIELLVVVAIIGILATVVLASLGSARTRAKDSAVIAATSNFRAEIELNYPNGDYTALCFTMLGYDDPNLQELSDYIEGQGGSIGECTSDSTSYRIVSVLPSGNTTAYLNENIAHAQSAGDAFCINSLGTAARVSNSDIESLVSPACTADESSILPGNYFNACPSSPTTCYDQATATYVPDSYCVNATNVPSCR